MCRLSGTFLFVFALGLAIAEPGCASIMSKSVYPVIITSEPTHADITILDKKDKAIYEGRTPTTVELKASRGWFQPAKYQVKVSLAGHNERTIPIKQKLDGWYVFGNILVGGLIGWVIVDPITGAMWTVEDVHVQLEPTELIAQPESLPPGGTPAGNADTVVDKHTASYVIVSPQSNPP